MMSCYYLSMLNAYREVITVDDTVFLLLHALLLIALSYGLYDQFFRDPILKLHSRMRRKIKKAIRNSKNKVKNFRNRIALKVKRVIQEALKQDGPHTQIVHAKSIQSESDVYGPVSLKIKRGEGSWQYFGLTWTVLSVTFIESTTQYEYLQDVHASIGVIVTDVVALTWLCFYNRWFRNIIIRIVNHRNQTPE